MQSNKIVFFKIYRIVPLLVGYMCDMLFEKGEKKVVELLNKIKIIFYMFSQNY